MDFDSKCRIVIDSNSCVRHSLMYWRDIVRDQTVASRERNYHPKMWTMFQHLHTNKPKLI